MIYGRLGVALRVEQEGVMRRERRAATRRARPHTGELSGEELAQLTAFKWRYMLETVGFSETEANRLIFIRWLRQSGTRPL